MNHGWGGKGGGIITDQSVQVTITDSTLQANTTRWEGGGIYLDFNGTGTIINSTITHNASNLFSTAGGIDYDEMDFIGTIELHNAIVANNFRDHAKTQPADIQTPPYMYNEIIGTHNLIGHAETASDFQTGVDGNIVGVDTLLGDL